MDPPCQPSPVLPGACLSRRWECGHRLPAQLQSSLLKCTLEWGGRSLGHSWAPGSLAPCHPHGDLSLHLLGDTSDQALEYFHLFFLHGLPVYAWGN